MSTTLNSAFANASGVAANLVYICVGSGWYNLIDAMASLEENRRQREAESAAETTTIVQPEHARKRPQPAGPESAALGFGALSDKHSLSGAEVEPPRLETRSLEEAS